MMLAMLSRKHDGNVAVQRLVMALSNWSMMSRTISTVLHSKHRYATHLGAETAEVTKLRCPQAAWTFCSHPEGSLSGVEVNRALQNDGINLSSPVLRSSIIVAHVRGQHSCFCSMSRLVG
eukprot:Blabericola_migrator_1__5871@NODE_2973_length_2149_cov_22_990874_g1861_i0_p1_GENE_NODE_2973_length_2149_cov_22_990874_g1861_i0NODE_2973_length_2149_cov_22_990874_g1861_i0_p1_ORF_typecomplete_len120_score5_35_NODE_2973_length_2149_cov_22_990874_g1861_i011111470